MIHRLVGTDVVQVDVPLSAGFKRRKHRPELTTGEGLRGRYPVAVVAAQEGGGDIPGEEGVERTFGHRALRHIFLALVAQWNGHDVRFGRAGVVW